MWIAASDKTAGRLEADKGSYPILDSTEEVRYAYDGMKLPKEDEEVTVPAGTGTDSKDKLKALFEKHKWRIVTCGTLSSSGWIQGRRGPVMVADLQNDQMSQLLGPYWFDREPPRLSKPCYDDDDDNDDSDSDNDNHKSTTTTTNKELLYEYP